MQKLSGLVYIGAFATAIIGFGILAMVAETTRWVVDGLSDD